MEFTALRVGTTLHYGTYIIKQALGQGGFGITYLAYDTKLEKEVAIKEFFPETLCTRHPSTGTVATITRTSTEMVDQLKRKFLKEARNIARLNHPNIVKIFSAFEENETAYYVMEYIEGISLSERVKEYGAVRELNAIDYINQIGSALEYLHSCHMTHLDVKPANIMIRVADDCPVLIDFGLSRNYDTEGVATTTQGTLGISPGFSPIEQYVLTANSNFSPQSDLYSLAATFYYLLTASVPPEAPLIQSYGLEFPPSVAPNLRDAIEKAMSPGLRNRHESVKEFLDHINSPAHTSHGPKVKPHNAGISERTVIDVRNSLGRPTAERKKHDVWLNKKTWPFIIVAGIFVGVFLILIFGFLMQPNTKSDSERDVSEIYEEPLNLAERLRRDALKEKTISDAGTADPVRANRSEYGPFDSRQELMDYIEEYYRSVGDGTYARFIADEFETNYGRPMKFTRQEYVDFCHNAGTGAKTVSINRDFNWGELKTEPQPGGGVLASFSQISSITTSKDGVVKTKKFRLDTNLYFNSQRQLYKLTEKDKLLEERIE